MSRHPATVAALDPFGLPDWLGTEEVVWTAQTGVRGSWLVTGLLSAGQRTQPCDLLAADRASPQPVLDERWRPSAHHAWRDGQVLLVEYDGRPTLVVPGTELTADLAMEVLARLAKAVGGQPARFVAALRL